jgi:alpha-ketoglutarate-dependent taurine dioxygenase
MTICCLPYFVISFFLFLKNNNNNNSVSTVAERISYVRPTMYGTTWDVLAVPNPINVAYTDIRLELHQDLLYYEAPPGLQFLHCLHAKAQGGENFFVWTMAVSMSVFQ